MARWFVDRCAHRGIPAVSLRRLLPEATFPDCPDLVVSGASRDSRRLEPGQVFVAIPGRRFDGHDFVGQALARGAMGAIVERPVAPADGLEILVPDARAAYARLCQSLAGHPAESLRIVGIAGTHGRRTTAAFLGAILDAAGEAHGSIGPGAWSDGRDLFRAVPATPGPEALAEMLAAAVDRGTRTLILTLSGDSIDRRGIAGIDFETAVITQLAGSHGLDEVRRRRRLAARLLRAVKPGGTAILPADDPEAAPLAGTRIDGPARTFGLGTHADLRAAIDRSGPLGSLIRAGGHGDEWRAGLRLPGTWNVRYAAAAALAAGALGIEVGAIIEGLESVDRIPGCLERVDRGQEFEVRIDRARTAPAVSLALGTLREITGAGRIHCVLGSKGRTDLAARLALARAAEAGADQLYLTADDPVDEEPAVILDDMRSGLRHPSRSRVIADRREAIEAALGQARAGDVVLIAGKGRAPRQIEAARPRPFEDAAVVEDWLDRRIVSGRRLSA